MSGQPLRRATSGTQAYARNNQVAQDTLTIDGIAIRYSILPETAAALRRKHIFPSPDAGKDCWYQATLDRTFERLLHEGLPPGYRLPYTHEPPRRLVDETVRRHSGWRHRKKSKLIGEPVDSPAFVREWLSCERAYAIEQTVQSKNGSVVDHPPLTSPPRPPMRLPAIAVDSRSLQPIPPVSNPKLPSAPKLAAAESLSRTSDISSVYFTPEELCERWRQKIAPETLANWRALHVGPAFNKFGKAILYPVDLLKKWESRNLRGCDLVRPVNDREVGEV